MSLNKRAIYVSKFEIEDILPFLASHKQAFTVKDIDYIVYFGRATQRVFIESQKCVACDRQGTHFRLYHDPVQQIPKFINSMCLFSDDDILMTADHIVPRSAGGLTHPVNLQVMCQKCNQKKGAIMPPPEIAEPIQLKLVDIKKEYDTKWPKPLSEPLEKIKELFEFRNSTKKLCDSC